MWCTDRQHEGRGAAVVDRLDLLKVTFPHSDLFVATNAINANQHGVDSSPRGGDSSRAEGERLRDLPDAHGATLARKRFRLRVLNRLLMVTLTAWAVVLLVI
ncbi:MAG TPA: hypothetical protein VKG20_13495 [Methylomirabilota bacterium]|nr:hypothetical protein [Methylomirabilota bacterium]